MVSWTWEELRRSTVVVEDDAILALNKPADISVMGERHDTDLVRMAAAAGEELFPVHRIDKVTSGVTLLAKNLAVHGGLTRQFNKRTVDKAYLVITRSVGLPSDGLVELPLSAGRKGTVRIAAPRDRIQFDEQANRWGVASQDLLDIRMYPSTTRIARIWQDGELSLVVAQPITGRRHQIRVHMAWIGHPILGDPLFEKGSPAENRRTCLHSWRLGFDAAWRRDRRVDIEAPAGDDFWAPLASRLDPDSVTVLLAAARDRLAGQVDRSAPGNASPQ